MRCIKRVRASQKHACGWDFGRVPFSSVYCVCARAVSVTKINTSTAAMVDGGRCQREAALRSGGLVVTGAFRQFSQPFWSTFVPSQVGMAIQLLMAEVFFSWYLLLVLCLSVYAACLLHLV